MNKKNMASVTRVVNMRACLINTPDDNKWIRVDGLTLRQALKKLRSVNWGDMGQSDMISLSDGSYLVVQLQDDGHGSLLMNSQQAVRYEEDRGLQREIRSYKIA